MHDCKYEVRFAIEACNAAFADKSMYASRAVRDYHIRRLERLIDGDFATRAEEVEITRIIEFIVSIDAVDIMECRVLAS